MQYEYTIFAETPEKVILRLSSDCRKRRLEKGWSRGTLSEQSGVPAPTIARFERTGRISLESFASISIALGYFQEVSSVLSEVKYSTSSELATINKNRNRQKGR